MKTINILIACGALAIAQAQLPPAPPPASPPVATAQHVTPFELSEHPDQYHGKTIAMIGDVDDVYGTRAFTVNEGLPWTNAGDILVLAPELKKEFSQVAYIRVRGKVVRPGDAELEKFLTDVPTLTARVRDDFKKRAIVLAETVTGPDMQDLTVR